MIRAPYSFRRGLPAEFPGITEWKRCRFDHAYDGDTVWLSVLLDQAKGVSMEGWARLMGVQCPEVRTTDLNEKRKGYCAKWYTEAWFGQAMSGHLHGQDPADHAFYAYAREDDKYGRWLAHIECINGHCLNDDLLASNNAISYLGPTGLANEEQF